MKTYQSIVILKPKRLLLSSNRIEITDNHMEQYQIPYRDLIFASLIITDGEKGLCYEPEITEITKDLEGDLILYDCWHTRWQIRLDGTGKRAGSLLSELATHAPHILIGRQTWVDMEDEADFEEISNMVKLMNRC